MAILHVAQKRTISPWISGVVILLALAIATYLLWPEAPKHEGVVLNETAQQMLVAKATTNVDLPPAPEQKEEKEAQRAVAPLPINERTTVVASGPASPYMAPLPPFGEDAKGAPGAWDGHNEDGANSAPEQVFSERYKDHLGNPCYLNSEKLPIDSLRAMVPPPDMDDQCGYRSSMVYRKDTLPADFFRIRGVSWGLATTNIKGFVQGGKWSIADFEELVRRRQMLAQIATLNVYLILKQANSPMTSELLNAQNSSFDRSELDQYLKTGKCPGDVNDVAQFCLDK